jgi:hypothetical protein
MGLKPHAKRAKPEWAIELVEFRSFRVWLYRSHLDLTLTLTRPRSTTARLFTGVDADCIGQYVRRWLSWLPRELRP